MAFKCGRWITDRCSFCAQEETPERKLVAGASVFICGACASLATDVLAAASLGDKVYCAVCPEVIAPG